MSYFNKNRILLWLVVAIIIINFTAIGTIIIKMHNMENFDKEKNERPCAQSFIEKELRLTPLQSEKFKKLKNTYHDTVFTIYQTMKEKREFISANMVSSEPDTISLNKAADELGVLYSQTRKLYIQHYFDLRKVCTPEQQEKLASIYSNIFSCDEKMPGAHHGRECQRDHKGHGGHNACNSQRFIQ